MIFARPKRKKGAGLGIKDSIQCRATAMEIKSAMVAMREFSVMEV